MLCKMSLHSNSHPKGVTTALCVSQLIPSANDECRCLAREAQEGGFNRQEAFERERRRFRDGPLEKLWERGEFFCRRIFFVIKFLV